MLKIFIIKPDKTKFTACNGNVKDTWKNINKILGKKDNVNKIFKIQWNLGLRT